MAGFVDSNKNDGAFGLKKSFYTLLRARGVQEAAF